MVQNEFLAAISREWTRITAKAWLQVKPKAISRYERKWTQITANG
jgi:hypothetical protein